MSRFAALLLLGFIGIAAGNIGARSETEPTPVSQGGEVPVALEEIARRLASAALVESTSQPVNVTRGAGAASLADRSDI